MNVCSSSHPDSVPHEVPQVLINREQLPHLNFDVELLGDCDVIVNEICHRLSGDFEQICYNTQRLSEITEKPPRLPKQLPSEALPNNTSAPEEQEQNITDSETQCSGDTENLNVTEAASNSETPAKPCPNTHWSSKERAEPSESSPEEAHEELERKVRSQTSITENHRCRWISQINRSPISKYLEGKLINQTRGKLVSLRPHEDLINHDNHDHDLKT